MIRYVLFVGLMLGGYGSQAQGLLNKIKQKAAAVADKAIDKKTDDLIYGKKTETSQSTNTHSGTSVDASGNVYEAPYIKKTNKVGGLDASTIDVNKSLDESLVAFNANSLGEARYAVKQSLLAIETEIGREVLKSLPVSLANLSSKPELDKVISSGFGWEGMVLTKVYEGGEQQIEMEIMNNNALVSTYQSYVEMAVSQSLQPNIKMLKIKNYKAIAEYNQSQGYKISIPLSQSVIVIFKAINFEKEADLISTLQTIDFEMIKIKLD